MSKTLKVLTLGVAASVLYFTVAQAATVSACTSSQAAAVAGASGCAVGSMKNPSQRAVNADNFFGFSDWTFISKDNGLDGADEGDLSALTIGNTIFKDGDPGEPIGGTWSIDPGRYLDHLLVFKGGAANFVGYLLGEASGAYVGMLGSYAISNVSLFGRGDVVPLSVGLDDEAASAVPLPAGALLLASALAGAGIVSRARRRRV